MKETFRDKLGLNKHNTMLLDTINEIIEEYVNDGYKLTLRQLYYQLVSRDIIPNNDKEYHKLSRLLTKGRMAGVVDWSAIEDRMRVPHLPYWVHGIGDALKDTIDQYRLDRMEKQKNYVELWVEKDALSGVLSRVTEYYHIRLMVNRGYSSITAMYQASQRFKSMAEKGKTCYILYLGDHDPSGLDMVRDVQDRMEAFGTFPIVEHIALTKEQINRYNPPPNPAKLSDSRANEYIIKHGDKSWEVDALPPKVLHQIIKARLNQLVDIDLFTEAIEQECEDKEKLQSFIDNKEDE